jgi:hypothetical protein
VSGPLWAQILSLKRAEGPARPIEQDSEPEQIGRNRHFRDTLHHVRMTHPWLAAHVAQGALDGFERSLDLDEDRAVVPACDCAHHAAATGRLRDSRAVVHSLDAAVRRSMPADKLFHGPPKPCPQGLPLVMRVTSKVSRGNGGSKARRPVLLVPESPTCLIS